MVAWKLENKLIQKTLKINKLSSKNYFSIYIWQKVFLTKKEILIVLKQIFKFADSGEGIGLNLPQYMAIPEKTTFFGHFNLNATLIYSKTMNKSVKN